MPGKGHQIAEAVTRYGSPMKAATLAETTLQTAAGWTRISVPASNMAGCVAQPGAGRSAHAVLYTNAGPLDRFFSEGEYLFAADGVCIFPTAGDWWILLPQVGAAPVIYNFILFDATSLSPIIPQLVAAQAGAAQGGGAAAAVQNRLAIQTNQKNVTTSGTPVQLTAMVVPAGSKLVMVAKSTNTQKIYFSDTSGHAQKASGVNGFLAPGQSVSFLVTNATAIFIDADVNGEGVWYGAEV